MWGKEQGDDLEVADYLRKKVGQVPPFLLHLLIL
jgi:hypothetical protein